MLCDITMSAKSISPLADKGCILEWVTSTTAARRSDKRPISEKTAKKMWVEDLRSRPLKMSSSRRRSGLQYTARASAFATCKEQSWLIKTEGSKTSVEA